MEFITRKELDRISQLLQNHLNTEESIKLAATLQKADIIPKLYQYAYVEALHQILSKYPTAEKLKKELQYSYHEEKQILETHTAFDAVKEILYKAHNRQDEICDFEDSTLAPTMWGRCQDDEHYENTQDFWELSEEEQEKWDKYDSDGMDYNELCEKFQDITNPEQKLTLLLWLADDETKCKKDDGIYVCETCLDVARENAEGGMSCDIDMADAS